MLFYHQGHEAHEAGQEKVGKKKGFEVGRVVTCGCRPEVAYFYILVLD